MQINTKAFTLVEMLVAMAVSTIIIAATYASYDLVAKQYKKNLDIAEMHTSGRAIMQIIERDIRMAGFEYRATNGKVTYGTISNPLLIKDSGNKCCDEVTVIYDYFDEDTKKVERIRSRYWTEAYTSNKGTRYRLNKRRDILGKNNAILATPILGMQSLMADFVEDFQIVNITTTSSLYGGNHGNNDIRVFDPSKPRRQQQVGTVYDTGYIDALAFGPDGLLYGGNHGNNDIRVFDPSKPRRQQQVGTVYDTGYIDALAYKIKRTGQESLVTINLTLRTRNPYGINKQFKKKDYHGGNFKIDKTDKYKRDTFSSTVLVRNLML
jgi:prepilin-type N-terminal cleavage/methylation domain-containing protein